MSPITQQRGVLIARCTRWLIHLLIALVFALAPVALIGAVMSKGNALIDPEVEVVAMPPTPESIVVTLLSGPQ